LYFKNNAIICPRNNEIIKIIVNATLFDYLILSIMLFFSFLGLLRGFIRELFSLINWVGSGILTVMFRPFINDLISTKISNTIASNILSSALIFFIAIVGLSILTSNIAKAINTKFPSSINITLGLAFGFTKGFLICSLIFATILSVFGNTDDLLSKSGPKWLQNSQTYRPLSFGAYIILPFADSVLGQIHEKYSTSESEKDSETESKKDNLDNNLEDLRRYKEDDGKMDELIQRIDDVDDPKPDNGGYKKEQMKKLNHLIEIL